MNMDSNIASRPKVKLVAIAKDEGAYLSEWIHHHLYFGFDSIEIYINRTTDNSAEVLQNIAEQNSNVFWDYADWVDVCPGDAKNQIQFIVYAKALHEARKNRDFTHILFLDIDEYWCSKSFNVSIQDYIESMPEQRAIFFEWVNDLGNLEPFSHLPAKLEGNISPLGKTLLPVELDIIELRHHVPLLVDATRHILVDGQCFESRPGMVQALTEPLNLLKDVFVFHRAHRSAYEYVSLVYRGRPGNNFKYKANRKGLPRPDRLNCCVELPAPAYRQYQESLAVFKDKTGYQQTTVESTDFVKLRYEQSVANIKHELINHYEEMKIIFIGVKEDAVLAAFRTYRALLIKQQPHNVVFIRDLAIDAAKSNLEEAIELMEIAQQLRPKGPQIRKKLENWKNKRNALRQITSNMEE
jgi:hypothetical protein